MICSEWDRLPKDIKWTILQRNWKEQYQRVLEEVLFATMHLWMYCDRYRIEGANWCRISGVTYAGLYWYITHYKGKDNPRWSIASFYANVENYGEVRNCTALRPRARNRPGLPQLRMVCY